MTLVVWCVVTATLAVPPGWVRTGEREHPWRLRFERPAVRDGAVFPMLTCPRRKVRVRA